MSSYRKNPLLLGGLTFSICLAAAGRDMTAQTTQSTPSTQTTQVEQELNAMKARIADLQEQLKAGGAAAPAPAAAAAAPATPDIGAETTTKSAPFPGDWTWLNSNGRVVDFPMATKYFTPEFRADVNYILDFNHPEDDTMGGSTESFRSNECSLAAFSIKNVPGLRHWHLIVNSGTIPLG